MTYTCKKIIDNHCPEAWFTLDHEDHSWHWKLQHYRAVHWPRAGTEKGIWTLICGFAELADGYATQCEVPLGQDGYYHDHALGMIEAMRAYLNFDVGRFDCGTLDRLIRDLAKAAGVELDP